MCRAFRILNQISMHKMRKVVFVGPDGLLCILTKSNKGSIFTQAQDAHVQKKVPEPLQEK